MTTNFPHFIELSSQVVEALESHQPVVALESTVITHGLPYPENIKLALDMENTVRLEGAQPATIGLLGGKVIAGLTSQQLQQLANEKDVVKVSIRDIAPAVMNSSSGGTTVAATMLVANQVGIRVFATGGIGGVHRSGLESQGNTYDISADLHALGRIPVIVVCAGAKAILDLPATLEVLESLCVPVVGYQTDKFPAFYSRDSGLKTSARADSPEKIVQIAQAHWSLGSTSSVLVVTPPPEEVALPRQDVEEAILQALGEASAQQIQGQRVTPFLLERVNVLTGGASLRANLGLLLNNARLAAQIERARIDTDSSP